MIEKLNNPQPPTPEDYDTALGTEGTRYLQELTVGNSQPSNVEVQPEMTVAEQPVVSFNTLPTVDERERFNNFVQRAHRVQELVTQSTSEKAPGSVKGVVRRLTAWFREKGTSRIEQDVSYPKMLPFPAMGAAAITGSVFDNRPRSAVY